MNCILNTIKEYLDDVIRDHLHLDTEYLHRFSSFDLYYLYLEIFKKYKIKLSAEEIKNDCFRSTELLAKTIEKQLNINEVCKGRSEL